MSIKLMLKKYIPLKFLKKIKNIFVVFGIWENVSGQYRLINSPNKIILKQTYNDVWKDSALPGQQLKITDEQLKSYDDVAHISALIRAIKNTEIVVPHILEVGCSTGYHGEFFKKAGISLAYEGCDYSEAFIFEAKKRYPERTFCVSDATQLLYPEKKFQIVISGCCILHIIDYEEAIKESARVAKDFVIFHRTPVLHQQQTSFFEKKGYGKKMIEIFFNEKELFELFYKYGLLVQSVETLESFEVNKLIEPVFVKEYVCKKML